jgi:hypothetical protein
MNTLSNNAIKLLAALRTAPTDSSREIAAIPIVHALFFGRNAIAETIGIDALFELDQKGLIVYWGTHKVAGCRIPTVHILKQCRDNSFSHVTETSVRSTITPSYTCL